jgi:hypothetical protein
MLRESKIGRAKVDRVTLLLLRQRDDIRGENWVKVQKYEGKPDKTPRRAGFSEARKEFSGESWFALAGVILILALCDLRILFTSY